MTIRRMLQKRIEDSLLSLIMTVCHIWTLCRARARTARPQKTSNRTARVPPYNNLITDKKSLWNIMLDSSMLTTYDKESRWILPFLLFIKEYLHMYFTNYAGIKSRKILHFYTCNWNNGVIKVEPILIFKKWTAK